MKKPKISDYSTEAISALIAQQCLSEEKLKLMLMELKDKYTDMSIIRLCFMYEKEKNQDVKYLIKATIEETIQETDEILELKSLRNVMQDFSLIKLCECSNSSNTLVGYLAQEQLDNLIHDNNIAEKNKTKQKQNKRRKR